MADIDKIIIEGQFLSEDDLKLTSLTVWPTKEMLKRIEKEERTVRVAEIQAIIIPNGVPSRIQYQIRKKGKETPELLPSPPEPDTDAPSKFSTRRSFQSPRPRKRRRFTFSDTA